MGTPRRMILFLTAALGLALSAFALFPLRAQVVMGRSVGNRGGAPPVSVSSSPNVPAEDPPSTTDRIDGVVVSSIDSKPVSRVLVTTGDRRFAALTDYEGRFSFDLRRPIPQPGDSTASAFTPPGFQQNSTPVQLQLRKPGYIPGNIMVYFPAVRADTPPSPIQLTIQPAATLTGHVYAESGDLPTNFTVQLVRKGMQDGRANWNIGTSVRIDPDGTFRAPNLAPGDYKLLAYAPPSISAAGKNAPASIPGFLPAFYPNASTLDGAIPIHIAAGDTASANLTLRRAAFYHVTVPIAGDSEPQGLRAILSPGQSGLSLNYNNADRALEGFLPSGEYDVHLISTPRPAALNNGPGVVMFVTPDAGSGIVTMLSATVHLSVGSVPLIAKPVALRPAHQIPVEVNAELTGSDTSQDTTRRSMYSFNLMPDPPNEGFAQTQPQPRAPRGSNTPPQSPTFITATGGRYHFSFFANGAYVASAICGGVDLLDQPLVIDDSVAPQPIFVTLRDDYASLNIHLGPSAAAPAAAASTPGASSASGPEGYALAIPLDRIESQNLGPFALFAANSPIAPRNNGSQFRLPPGHYLILAAHDIQSLINLEYRNPDVLRDLTAQGVTINLTAGQQADIEAPLLPASTANTTPQIIMAGAQ